MRTRTTRLAALGALALVAGCSAPAPAPDDELRPRVLAEVADVATSEAETMVTVEIRVLEVDPELAEEWAGPVDATRVVHLPAPRLRAVLDAARESSRARQVSAPRVAVFAGQEARMQVTSGVGFVRDYALHSGGRGAPTVVDPVVGTVEHGLTWTVRPERLADGRLRLSSTCALTDLDLPMEVVTRTFAGRELEFEVPRLTVARHTLDLVLNDGGTVLVALPEAASRARRRVFLFRAQATRVAPQAR